MKIQMKRVSSESLLRFSNTPDPDFENKFSHLFLVPKNLWSLDTHSLKEKYSFGSFHIGLYINDSKGYYKGVFGEGELVYIRKKYSFKGDRYIKSITNIYLGRYKHYVYFEVYITTFNGIVVVKLGLDMKPLKDILRSYLIKLIN